MHRFPFFVRAAHWFLDADEEPPILGFPDVSTPFCWNTLNVSDIFTNNSEIDEYCRWFLYEFPLHYYNILSEMTFPKWYIASFCKTCTDGRNWAQYGDSHRGVCLVFKTHSTTNGKGLKLMVCNEYCSTRGKIFNYHI